MFASFPRYDLRARQDQQTTSNDGTPTASSSQVNETQTIESSVSTSSDGTSQATTSTDSSTSSISSTSFPTSTSSSSSSFSSSPSSTSESSSPPPSSSTSTSSSQRTQEISSILSISSSSSIESVSATSSSDPSSSSRTLLAISLESTSGTSAVTSQQVLVTAATTNSLIPSSPGTVLSNPLPTTHTSAPPAISSNASPVGATSEGFWSNKKAVAGTFTALAILLFGVLITIIIFLIRRRRRDRARASDRDTLFSDKFPPEPGLISRPQSFTASDSEDLHRRQPMDANASAGYHNYQNQNSNPFADTHPAPYSNGSLTEITYSYARDAYNQYPAYDYDGSSKDLTTNGSNQQLPPPPQSYFDPLNPSSSSANGSSNSLSNPFRDPSPGMTTSGRSHLAKWSHTPDRNSTSYQPSLDSFYGIEPSQNGAGCAR